MEKLITKILFFVASIAIPLILVKNDPSYSWVWFGPAPLFLIFILEEVFKSKFTRALAAIALGLFVGALISFTLARIFDVGNLFPTAAIVICYVFVSYSLQINRDIRFSLPFVSLRDESKKADCLVLDVSALIDGRLFELYRAGVLDKRLIIPKFVQNELQKIANVEDKTQRARGLRGAEVLKNILGNSAIPASVHESDQDTAPGTMEERLVKLAQSLNGRLVSTDLNVCKAALAQGISVINLNELGSAMRATVVYGEKLTLDVVKPGKDTGQGVGYLEDGTMVVVENGRGYIGQKVEITVTSFSQTVAGKMIFGRIEGATRDLRESAPRPAFNAPRPAQPSQQTPHKDFDKNRSSFQKGPDRRRHDNRSNFNNRKPDERRTDDRSVDRPADRPADRPTDRSADRPAERPADRPVDRPIDRPAERPVERSAEQRGGERREERRDDFRDKKEESPKMDFAAEKKPLPANVINPYALNITPLETREARVEKKPTPPPAPQPSQPAPSHEESREKSSGSSQRKFGEGLDNIDEV